MDDNNRMYVKDTDDSVKRYIPPFHEREELVKSILRTTAFPNGLQLY